MEQKETQVYWITIPCLNCHKENLLIIECRISVSEYIHNNNALCEHCFCSLKYFSEDGLLIDSEDDDEELENLEEDV